MGHALELVQGDCLTRYARSQGKDVQFLIGMDEHGTKMHKKAQERGISPQELADENAQLFRDIAKTLGLAHDIFIRTTDDLHKRGARKLWKMIDEAGKFYEKEYEGLYCSGCEAFLLEKDLIESLCPHHKSPPEELKEKNIFFKLSDYGDEIRRLVESDELLILPSSRKKEFLSFLREGLKDVSFSRPKSVLPWGIEVPSHEDQVMYVWCDALSNYLTALGYADDDPKVAYFWPADVHLIGKDIVRFHAAYWPAMLMAARLPLPKAIYVHGFVTSNGHKMSKSLGNVVSPNELLKDYGQDALRYYLLREIPSDDDGDFSYDRFEILYKDELQNTIGNLIRRVLSMNKKYLNGVALKGEDFDEAIDMAWGEYHEKMQNFQIRQALESMIELAREGNSYVEINKPWLLAKKEDKKRLEEVLGSLISVCRAIGEMLRPVIPLAAEKILNQVASEEIILGDPLFPPLLERE